MILMMSPSQAIVIKPNVAQRQPLVLMSSNINRQVMPYNDFSDIVSTTNHILHP